MHFNGFNKLTLLDYPGKMACILFTSGCNFRCPFCHNASLVTHTGAQDVFEEDEILAYLKKRQGMLGGVCVSGGEPLLHKDLPEFLKKVKALGYSVKLDTNGSMLDRLKSVVEAGLCDYVAMDIKNSMENYPKTAGCAAIALTDIEKSIDYLMQGRVDYEFRTTVVKELHTVEDIESIAKRIAGGSKYFLQNFIDSGDLIGHDLHAVDRQTLDKMLDVAKNYVPNTKLRGV